MNSRKEYEEQFQQQINAWQLQMDKLRAQAEVANADARILINDQLASLKARQEEAEKTLEQLRDAGNDAWDDLKSGMEESMAVFEGAIKSAMSRFVK